MDLTIRSAALADAPFMHRMNEAAEPAVNSAPLSFFERYVSAGGHIRVAEHRGRVVGFVQIMHAAESYRSLNFQWFKARYSAFVYIDRVVVAPSMQGRGVGYALYDDLRRRVGGDTPRIVCEVNIRPLNARSLRFHARFGFQPVGTQDAEHGRKTVQLMCLACRPD